MPRFYFDVLNAGGLAADRDGRDLSGIEEARAYAAAEARRLLAEGDRHHEDRTDWAIQIRTSAGDIASVALGAASLPAAGPHADPSLTNPMATPGSGVLPSVEDDSNMQPTS